MEVPSKICTQCHVLKPLTEYTNEPLNKDGLAWQCKACAHAYSLARITKPKVVPEAKMCPSCEVLKPIADFGGDKYTKDGHATRCKACKRGESASWRQDEDNAKKARAGAARWKAENPEKVQAYVDANKDKISQRRRERYAANPTKENEQSAAYYERRKDWLRPKRQAWEAKNYDKRRVDHLERYLAQDPEERRAQGRAWGAANPDKVREKNTRRTARKKNAPVNDLTDAQWDEIKSAFDFRCAYCPPDCKACKKKTHDLTKDHVTPYRYNGSNTLWNVVPACLSCNSRKHDGPPPLPVQPLLLSIAPSHKAKKKKDA